MSEASKVEDDEHTQITIGLDSLIGRVQIERRRVKCLYGPNVRMASTDATVRLMRSTALEREQCETKCGVCLSI